MQSVIVSDFGVMLGQTSERLVAKGPRPRPELVEGGPQLWLPLDLPAPSRRLRLVTSEGVKEPPASLRLTKPKPGSRGFDRPPQLELPLGTAGVVAVRAPMNRGLRPRNRWR
jgi:hypothetical protein